MKFAANTPQVDVNVLQNVPIQASRDINAYGGSGAGISALNAGLGQVNKVVAKQQDDEDAAAVVGARNQIMTELTERLYGEKGLFTTGIGTNAQGLTKRTNDVIKEVSQNVMSQQNGRVARTLQGNLSENIENFGRIAASQERSQKIKVDEANYNGAQANTVELASMNYNKPDFVASQIGQSDRLMQARAISQGWTGQELTANRREQVNKVVGGAALAAIQGKDYDSAANLLNTYRAQMDQGTYGKLMEAVKGKQMARDTKNAAADIVSRCLRPDGRVDFTAAYQAAHEAAIHQKRGNGTDAGGFEKGYEAWGNQVMDNGRVGCVEAVNKIGSFGSPFLQEEQQKGVAGVETLVSDAEKAQVPVVNFDAGQLEKGDVIVYRNTNEDNDRDHVVLYDGNGGFWGNSSNADGPNGNGRTVHGSDYELGGGLIPQYIIKTGVSSGGGEETVYDPDEEDMLKKQIDALAADKEREYKQQKQYYMESMKTAIRDSGSYSDAKSLIDGSSELTVDEQLSLTNVARSLYNVTASGAPRGSRNSGGVSASKISSSTNAVYKFDALIRSGSKISASQWATARQAVNTLENAGVLDESVANEMSDAEDNEQLWSLVQSMHFQGMNAQEIRNALIQDGMDGRVATMIISKFEPETYDSADTEPSDAAKAMDEDNEDGGD